MLDHFGGQTFFAEAEEAIEEGEGITHGAVAGAGDEGQGVFVGVDLFLLADVLQVPGDFARGDISEVIALAAGENRGEDFFGLRRGEDELHVFRGLLEGLEQRVEGRFTEHVHFVDDVDLESGAGGAVAAVFDDLADVIDAGVAGGVDLDDVDVVAAGDGEAGIAFSAGSGGGTLGVLAIQGFGEDSGHAGLAGASGAAEEVGMGQTVGFYGLFEGLGDVLLADDLVKGA